MKVKKEIPVTNRQTLELAIEQATAQRNAQARLLQNNIEVIKENYTLERITFNWVNQLFPKMAAGTAAYVTGMIGNHDDKSFKKSGWKSVLIELVQSIFPVLLKKLS